MDIQTLITSALTIFGTITEGISNLYVEQDDLEGDITSMSLRIVGVSALALFILIGIAILTKDKVEALKKPLFIMMATIMAGSTLFLGASTVYLNISADSGGPVHWHADIEFWVCDNEIELIDPTGFSNKVGTSTLHEHNDRRIHLEGVVVDDKNDASLGKFMHVIGGAITDSALVIPVNPDGTIFEDEYDGDGPSDPFPNAANDYVVTSNGKRYVKVLNGQTCSGVPSEVQVFVYQFNKEDDTYKQVKLANPKDYTIADDSIVPPGDCVIFEFGPSKDKTDKLCEQYGVRDDERCIEFGVDANKTGLCTIHQEDYSPIGTGADPNAQGSQQ